MNKKLNINLPKDYIVKIDGKEEKRTRWSRVGEAWFSKSGTALNIELFQFPNVVMSVSLKEQTQSPEKENE